MFLKEIQALILKDFRYEIRRRSAINGILLYVVSIVFVSYLSFQSVNNIDTQTWNALFWVILMFACLHTVSGTFVQESPNRQYYYFTLASPQAIILSKIIFNGLLVFAISLLCYFVYVLFLGNKVENELMFILCIMTGSIGISSVLTMVSAISSRTDNNFTMMAVLGFPLLLPLLLILMRLSEYAINGTDWLTAISYFLLLLLIDALVMILALILFPYLWRD